MEGFSEMYVTHSSVGIELSDKQLVGYFSVNERAVYCANATQLRYVYHNVTNDVSVHFNLNRGINNMVKKGDQQNTWSQLNNMFIWVSLNSCRLFDLIPEVFVTYRGVLQRIMCSPYEKSEDWTICARYCNGIIFLNRFDTPNNIKANENAGPMLLKAQLWGRKFEQYMLSDEPRKKPVVDKILNENEEFNCVFDSKLGCHRIIYGAEMDGILSNSVIDLQGDPNSLSNVKFVELKTNRIIDRENQARNFYKFKTVKWWCQSYLVGIETIICGFRDDNGIVRNLKLYKVNELPALSNQYWDKNVCLNFGDKFLTYVKNIVLKNKVENKDVWKFDFVPNLKKIFVSKVNDESSIYKSDFREVSISKPPDSEVACSKK